MPGRCLLLGCLIVVGLTTPAVAEQFLLIDAVCVHTEDFGRLYGGGPGKAPLESHQDTDVPKHWLAPPVQVPATTAAP